LNSNLDPININPNTQNIPNPSNNNLPPVNQVNPNTNIPPVNPNIGPIPVHPSEVANNNGVINSFVSSGILHSMFIIYKKNSSGNKYKKGGKQGC
jgi:hypothetical protein